MALQTLPELQPNIIVAGPVARCPRCNSDRLWSCETPLPIAGDQYEPTEYRNGVQCGQCHTVIGFESPARA